ncbi:MAG: PAS domain-containing sensor histidine kinase, partial [Candidatus Obscuribacterales bacterium]|nr:PAS domain-containing sensor histidine kinase [Candidatus Obscuribacterales bacterium]
EKAILSILLLNIAASLALLLPVAAIYRSLTLSLIIVANLILLAHSSSELRKLRSSIKSKEEDLYQVVADIQGLMPEILPASDSSSSPTELKDQLRMLSAQLTEIRKKERAIIEKAVDVICVIDINSRFLSISPSVERAWGYKVNELIGESVYKVLLAEKNEHRLEEIIGARESIEKLTFENRAKSKDGRVIDLSWSAHWSVSDEGLFCVVRDISERKLAEERLKESEERLRTTLESMPVGVLCTALSGVIEYANPIVESFTGKSRVDLLGIAITSLLDEKDRSAMSQILLDCKAGSDTKTLQTHIVADSDKRTPVEITVRNFSIQGMPKYLVSISDETVRVEKERLKREFTAMINHDLRSPLTSIAGLIGLINEGIYGDLVPRGKEVCTVAMAETHRLMRLINNLLDIDKIESGKVIIDCGLLDVDDVIQASIGSLDTFAKMSEVEIQFAKSKLSCWGDKERLVQVMVNLLSNAIKFSKKTSVVKITVEDLQENVCISVIDEGRGIPESKQGKLFERFEQVSPKDEVEKSGSGLGLSICKAIVEAHNGQISCTSKEMEGSTFSICIPKTDRTKA